MTDHATRKRSRVKRLLVRALFVHLRLEDVTRGAHVLDLVHPWRGCAMISMTCGAGGRADIAPHYESLMVNAGVVLCQLVRRNLISLHIVRVGMAVRASICNVDGIDLGPRIVGCPEIVNTVAVRAYRNLCISGSKSNAMNAGVILRQLICAQAGVELAHISRIGMAASAQLRNLPAIDLAFES